MTAFHLGLKNMKIEISRINIGTRYRDDYGDIAHLADLINRDGMLHPIVIDSEYNLIAGERRIMACQRLGSGFTVTRSLHRI